MFEEYMYTILPVFVLVSCVSAICILSYCKSRVLKNSGNLGNVTNPDNSGTTSNTRSHVNSPLPADTRPATTIFIVPTTSQVMDMYVSQANAAGGSQCKPPPSYGAVVDVPPSYEQAIEQHNGLENGPK